MEEISVLTPNFYLLFYHGFLEKAQNTPNALLLPAVVIILVPRLEAFSILLSSAQIEQDSPFSLLLPSSLSIPIKIYRNTRYSQLKGNLSF